MADSIVVTTPQCMVCGKTSTRLLDLEKFHRYERGAKVQDVWPEMPADERELLMTGTHGECWEKLFGGMEE